MSRLYTKICMHVLRTRRVQYTGRPALHGDRGVVDLIPLAITLPIAVLLFTAVVDFSREPITQERLLSSLRDAAYRVDYESGGDAEALQLDGFAPAGNNLCGFVPPVDLCAYPDGATDKQAFFSHSVSAAYVAKACSVASTAFQTARTSFLGMGGASTDFAFQFALLRAQFNSTTGEFEQFSTLGLSTDTCSVNNASFSHFSSTMSIDYNSIQAILNTKFLENTPYGGAWTIEDDSAMNGPYLTTRAPYLSSIWLVGIGYAQVHHLATNIFGPSKVMVEYFVRPLNNPAGIQGGGV